MKYIFLPNPNESGQYRVYSQFHVNIFFFLILLHTNLLHTIVYSAVFVNCNTDLLLETLFGGHPRIQSDAKYVVCNRNLKILFF